MLEVSNRLISVLADPRTHCVRVEITVRSGIGRKAMPAAGLRGRPPDRAAAAPAAAPPPVDYSHGVLSRQEPLAAGWCRPMLMHRGTNKVQSEFTGNT